MTKFRKKGLIIAVAHDINLKTNESLEELELLCKTLGIDVLEKVVQRREKPDPATYIGSGKLEKIKKLCDENQIDVVVFDDEITPVQQRNLESILKVPVLDRTQVILEIFSKHATTYEGKIQVEMAKLVYELPRLRGKGFYLSNPGAGIGTRGPGETALELDRRKLKQRIAVLRKELNKLKINRENTRRARLSSGYYLVSIVGYTNAGKSTLLSALSKESDILVSDKLFSTLNPTIRKVKLPSGRCCLVGDTVGFISKLPHTLVEAFHSTLEEILYSDLLLLVVDISDPFYKDKIAASYDVLQEIGAYEKPKMLVFNKIDALPEDKVELIRYEYPEAVYISAKHRIGFDDLFLKLESYFKSFDVHLNIKMAHSDYGLVSKYFEYVRIEELSSSDGYDFVQISGPESIVLKIKNILDSRTENNCFKER
ncbi:GTPase HflX [Fervidobacterium islandicum]|uniref:GTPase HflX n=1 Tax=Fervidobacterium islandicum TaxID=2423 RepID=A0AAI8CKJ4_FERIS|nr:GTPase HflX [Fervidobacterium islandicum]AMW32214.1 GTPase HflX [Fervidobacterium islandicum]